MGKYIGQELSYGLYEKQEIVVMDSSISEYYLNRIVSSANSIQVVCERAVLEPGIDYTVSTSNGRTILSLHNIDLSNPGSDGRLSLYVIFLGQPLITPATSNLPADVYAAIVSKADVSYVDNAIGSLVASAPAALNTLNELAAAMNNDENFAPALIAQVSDATTAVQTETQRAIAAEGVLASDIADVAADLAADIAAEETRALAAETVLTSSMTTEQSRAEAAEAALDTRVSALEAASPETASFLYTKRYVEKVTHEFNTSLTPLPSGDLVIDTSNGNCFVGALSGSVSSWVFENVPFGINTVGRATSVSVIIAGNVSYTYGDACTVNGVSISGGVKWSGGGVAPVSTSGTDIISFVIVCDEAGTIKVFGSATTNFV